MVVEVDIEKEISSFKETLWKLLLQERVDLFEWQNCFSIVYDVCFNTTE